MKFYTFILFASLIILSISDDSACDGKDADSAKDCKDIKISNSHCCYLKAKDEDGKSHSMCYSITDDQYNKIKDHIKEMEKGGGKVKKLDCKSIYLELSILSFIFLLL